MVEPRTDLRTDDPALAEALSRWAAAIHDDLTQTVAGAILQLEVLGQVIGEDPAQARSMLAETTTQMRGAMADVREVLFHLTEPGIDGSDLSATIATAQARWGVQVYAEIDDPLVLTPSVAAAVSQVLREAIANAATHGSGLGIEVRVRNEEGGSTVQVRDHGPGPLPRSEDRHHFGMRIMERQVAQAGGTLAVEPADGGGTIVTARFTEVTP